MNRTAHRSCHGKVRHRSERDARKALAGTIRETGDCALVYYACPHCRGWHVGHPPKAEQKRLRFTRLLSLIDRAVRS